MEALPRNVHVHDRRWLPEHVPRVRAGFRVEHGYGRLHGRTPGHVHRKVRDEDADGEVEDHGAQERGNKGLDATYASKDVPLSPVYRVVLTGSKRSISSQRYM